MSRVRAWWEGFDHGQQISLSILAPCAVLVAVLAVVSLRASIRMPFRAPLALLRQSDELLARQRDAAERANQSAAGKDTDGDGLTDQDEARVFRTSAYLADTDSDGIGDAEEIRRGTDPNCPPDRDCYGFADGSPDAVGDLPAAAASSSSRGAPLLGIEPPLPPEGLAAADARGYLLRNRLAPAAQLDALPDASVLGLYRRAYDDYQAAQTSVAPETPPADPLPSSGSSSLSTP